jgi:hypothetical protein
MRGPTCLSLTFAFSLLLANVMAQADQEGTGSAARRSDSITRKDSQLESLLKWVEEPYDSQKDGEGRVVFLALRSTNATDKNLSLVSTLQSLQELTIQGRGWPASNRWSLEGISYLEKLTNLTTLRILCQAVPPEINVQFLPEVSRLTKLRNLYLVAAPQEKQNYTSLTNLQNLVALHVSYDTNFGDAELSLLTNMPNLRNVDLFWNAVTPEGTNVLSRMSVLTNGTVRFRTRTF